VLRRADDTRKTENLIETDRRYLRWPGRDERITHHDE
jgi:hypothetical protein